MAQARFYVYHLVDPRNGTVFYVGKGQGSRVEQHEAEARRGVHSRKCDQIRAIWAEGKFVERRIVERFSCEIEAYTREAAVIEQFGLANLTNVVPGGIQQPRVVQPKGKLTIRHLRQVSKNMARAIRWLALGQRIMFGAYDMTDSTKDLIRSWLKEVGRDAFATVMREHGLAIEYA